MCLVVALAPSGSITAQAASDTSATVALGRSGPMDAQPVQSPVANSTYPPGSLTGSGSPQAPAWQGWVQTVGAAVVVVLLAGAVAAIWWHRRMPMPDPEEVARMPR